MAALIAMAHMIWSQRAGTMASTVKPGLPCHQISTPMGSVVGLGFRGSCNAPGSLRVPALTLAIQVFTPSPHSHLLCPAVILRA